MSTIFLVYFRIATLLQFLLLFSCPGTLLPQNFTLQLQLHLELAFCVFAGRILQETFLSINADIIGGAVKLLKFDGL